MKTAAEIIARMQVEEPRDWMGTIRSDLVDYLEFEDAKPYLKPEATAEMWAQREAKPPMDRVRDYLSFAWDKANDCRGLSAGRSLDHLRAWLFVAGYGDLVDAHFADYERYGKFQLVIASELAGFDWRAADNGEWVNDEGGRSLSAAAIQEQADQAKQIATEGATS